MNEILVLGLLSTLLTGAVGETVDATILAYSPVEQTVTVQNQSVHLPAQQTTPITVPLRIEKGIRRIDLEVTSSALTYHLPITVVGKRNLTWLWGLTIIPLAGLLLAIRIRKTNF